MRLEDDQKRLTIFVGESDRHGNTPLATEIVHRAHRAGLSGASVLRGLVGYGASNHIHTTRISPSPTTCQWPSSSWRPRTRSARSSHSSTS